MEILRTPEERFADLVDFPYEPRYLEVATTQGSTERLRVAVVDEGPRDGTVALLLHGEPSWGYLYRHLIPPLVAAGLRVVVPDLVGFGRSDKPAQRSDVTYAAMVSWMDDALFGQLDLNDVVLCCQDWGGLIGLRLLAAHPGRFCGAVVANTGLPTGERAPTDAFLAWQHFSQTTEVLPIGALLQGGTTRTLTEAEVAAYDAPFPDERYKEVARQLPSLVPSSLEDPASPDNLAAWEVLRRFEAPLLCAFSDADPITKGGHRIFEREVPGAQGKPHRTLVGGGHFLQEDCPAELAQAVLDCLALR